MYCETTLNCREEIKEKLDLAAQRLSVSRSALIVMLFRRIIGDHKIYIRSDRAVQYQKKIGKTRSRRLHIVIPMRDYEYFLDMRKFCKKSVSLLVFIAVNNYLDELLNPHDEKCETDNYQYIHYVLQKSVIDNIVCWTIYWGLPEKLTNRTP